MRFQDYIGLTVVIAVPFAIVFMVYCACVTAGRADDLLDFVDLNPVGSTQGAPHGEAVALSPRAAVPDFQGSVSRLHQSEGTRQNGQAGLVWTTRPARHLHAVPATFSDGTTNDLSRSFDVIADALAASGPHKPDAA